MHDLEKLRVFSRGGREAHGEVFVIADGHALVQRTRECRAQSARTLAIWLFLVGKFFGDSFERVGRGRLRFAGLWDGGL
jgi:hypothetical protein